MCGSTLLTRNTSSRRPAIAAPTSASLRPSPYISAVSISAKPMIQPELQGGQYSGRAAGSSAIIQVP